MTFGIRWYERRGTIELRPSPVAGPGERPETLPIPRYVLATQRRPDRHELFHGSYQPSLAHLRLPAALLPLVHRAGGYVPLAEVQAALPPTITSQPTTVLLPAAHELLPGEQPDQLGVNGEPVPAAFSRSRRLEAAWLQGLDQPTALRLQEQLGLLPGLWCADDEQVALLGPAFPAPLYLWRLPRQVLRTEQLIADNTATELTMERLLEEFVQQFSDPAQALPHVAIATGYLYQAGLQALTRLLVNPAVRTLRLLCSGRADRAVAEQLLELFCEELARGPLGQDPVGWAALQQDVQTGRLQVRIYTAAFLHAKLFLGHGATRDQRRHTYLQGKAVVGSSNVTGPGLALRGNLELDVTLESPEQVTQLADWFAARWDEAEPPGAALLTQLAEHRPVPPTFRTPGLDAVWHAGRQGRLAAPTRHLALLTQLYGPQLAGLPAPAEEPFPADVARTLEPSPEQVEGVTALVDRLLRTRVAFLADSVGLGKTITALGTLAVLLRRQLVRRVAVLAPRKLFEQWRRDATAIGLASSAFTLISRHQLERQSRPQAGATLAAYDLIVVEEAHEALRNRQNKLWEHLRRHLAAHPEARLLLVSATPWNNRREDIFNYLLLAWQEPLLLCDRYPALRAEPLGGHLWLFGGAPSTAASTFEHLPLATYRQLFDAVFVQRTRSRLRTRYGGGEAFPQRRVMASVARPSGDHDGVLIELARLLETLELPHREPLAALLRAASLLPAAGATVAPPPRPASNLHLSALIQLFKRAESSLFALAVSLAGLQQRLRSFGERLAAVEQDPAPREQLRRWLDPDAGEPDDAAASDARLDDEEEALRPLPTSPAARARQASVASLLADLDEAAVRELAATLRTTAVETDLAALAPLRQRLTAALEEREPKAQQLLRLAVEHQAQRHKPILVAGFADTALRYFLRLLPLLPESSIGLALGGDEGWVYRPGRDQPRPLTAAEWDAVLELPPAARRDRLLREAGRAQPLPREQLLQRFAPRSQQTGQGRLFELGGEVDLLVGSEAISVGQNLQDSSALIQLDLPWNPMVIEQRIGRIDRRGGGRPLRPDDPGSPPIVDVHYCWSSATIEAEVSLRERLHRKAGQAMEDTNFDELLLHELCGKIEQLRRERGGTLTPGQPDAALGDLLHRDQQALLAAQTGQAQLSPLAGSELDGLRLLAAWRDRQAVALAEVAPVVACGAATSSPWRWLLTLELTPLGPGGRVLPGPRLLRELPLRLVPDDPCAADLELLVHLLDGHQERCPRPSSTGGAWRRELLALDSLLQQERVRLLEEHNRQERERLAGLLQPAVLRQPGPQLLTHAVQALDALKRELVLLGRQPTGQAFLQAEQARLGFLVQEVLPPDRIRQLLHDRTEEELIPLLLELRTAPRRVLGPGFADFFARLCDAPWAEWQAHRAHREQPPPRARDGRWEGLELAVLAATRLAPDDHRGHRTDDDVDPP